MACLFDNKSAIYFEAKNNVKSDSHLSTICIGGLNISARYKKLICIYYLQYYVFVCQTIIMKKQLI